MRIIMTKKHPLLFQTIAQHVATGPSEQYLTVSKIDGLMISFSTPEIEAAMNNASQSAVGFDLVAYECKNNEFESMDVIVTDHFKGVFNVNGILVEMSVRKIHKEVYRALFSRVDAIRIYYGVDAILSKLAGAMQNIPVAIAQHLR